MVHAFRAALAAAVSIGLSLRSPAEDSDVVD